MSHPTPDRVCPRCRREAVDGMRCPQDGCYYVTREALAAAGRDALLGDLIADRYAIVERLGVGGMGAVYRALDEKRGGLSVAIKFLREEYATHRGIRQRFVREAEAGASLNSPYVVGLVDFGVEDDRTLYIVMEYVKGWTLRDEVNNNGPFSVKHARELARQLLLGLADAHDVELIHRDLKHDNVMFEGTRDRFVARILDFGVAKINATDTMEDGRVLTAAGAMVGSPSYMSPEQIRGFDVGPPADLYAMAVVLYEAMTARRLFPVNNYEALLRIGARRDAPPLLRTGSGEVVPPDFDRLLQRALAHDPADRFPDARTMLRALEQMELAPPTVTADLFSDAPMAVEPPTLEGDAAPTGALRGSPSGMTAATPRFATPEVLAGPAPPSLGGQAGAVTPMPSSPPGRTTDDPVVPHSFTPAPRRRAALPGWCAGAAFAASGAIAFLVTRMILGV